MTNKNSITNPCALIHPFYNHTSFTPRTTPLPLLISSSRISTLNQNPYAAPTYPVYPYNNPTSLCPTIVAYRLTHVTPAPTTLPHSTRTHPPHMHAVSPADCTCTPNAHTNPYTTTPHGMNP
jgi:hypothetical protein